MAGLLLLYNAQSTTKIIPGQNTSSGHKIKSDSLFMPHITLSVRKAGKMKLKEWRRQKLKRQFLAMSEACEAVF